MWLTMWIILIPVNLLLSILFGRVWLAVGKWDLVAYPYADQDFKPFTLNILHVVLAMLCSLASFVTTVVLLIGIMCLLAMMLERVCTAIDRGRYEVSLKKFPRLHAWLFGWRLTIQKGDDY